MNLRELVVALIVSWWLDETDRLLCSQVGIVSLSLSSSVRRDMKVLRMREPERQQKF